jgi:hypothetical protein
MNAVVEGKILVKNLLVNYESVFVGPDGYIGRAEVEP